MSTAHGRMAEGLWHSFHGRTQEAVQNFEQAAEMVRRSLCVNSHTILVLPMLARAVRLRAVAIKTTDPRQAAHQHKRALRLGKWAARITRFFPAAYPLSLRELSLIYEADGQLEKALRLAEKSCTIAQRQKARYELAQSSLVRSKLAHRLCRPGAAEEIDAAEAELERFNTIMQDAASRSNAALASPTIT